MLQENSKVRVKVYDTNGKEIVIRENGKIFTVKEQHGKLGIDFNFVHSPYLSNGEEFVPFENFAANVIFIEISTKEKYHFDSIENKLKKLNKNY